MEILTYLIFFLSIGILVGVISKKKNKPFRGEDVQALEVNHDEFYKILNFLLLYGVIDFEEYGKLEKKSLPFVR